LFLLFSVIYYLLLCFLLSLVALENVRSVALHHLPLSFAFHALRFLILIFFYDFVVCYVLVICFIYVVNYLLKYVV